MGGDFAFEVKDTQLLQLALTETPWGAPDQPLALRDWKGKWRFCVHGSTQAAMSPHNHCCPTLFQDSTAFCPISEILTWGENGGVEAMKALPGHTGGQRRLFCPDQLQLSHKPLCLTHPRTNPKWGLCEGLGAALLPGECVGMQGASTLRWGAKLPKCSPVRPCCFARVFSLASCSQVTLDGHPESWWMSTRAQEQTISHPVISIFQSDFDRYSCERLCLFRKELSQEDTEQAGKCTSSFPVVICVDNKPLAGIHNKRQVISPGMHSVCLRKGTFLHLLQVPQILPTAHSFPRAVYCSPSSE